MRSPLLLLAVLATVAPSQAPSFPSPYLAAQYLAPANAPSSVIVAGKNEPGERLVVTGRALDGTTPVAGVSVYVFQTDAAGLYATDVDNNAGELNPRLHAALRTDAEGRYRYETIRPGSYNNNAAHVHYVVRAPGYRPRLLDLWFEDDPILAQRRTSGASLFGTIPPRNHGNIAIRPVSRDANALWHSTRDLEMSRE